MTTVYSCECVMDENDSSNRMKRDGYLFWILPRDFTVFLYNKYRLKVSPPQSSLMGLEPLPFACIWMFSFSQDVSGWGVGVFPQPMTATLRLGVENTWRLNAVQTWENYGPECSGKEKESHGFSQSEPRSSTPVWCEDVSQTCTLHLDMELRVLLLSITITCSHI